MTYTFGRYTLDHERFELVADGERIALQPKVFDVLTYLVENPGRVISKAELIEQIWGDQFVSESALTTRIKEVREALGDDGRTQGIIRTVHGRGYEFLLDVSRLDGDDRSAPVPLPGQIRVPTKPLVGREAQLAEIVERLSSGRLLTLVGPAGAGKTHLARHAGGRVGEMFPGGSYFVPLTSVRDEGAVGQAVLDAVEQPRRDGASAEASAARFLTESPALVVLDNCEHVLDAVATLVGGLPPESKAAILATTRRRLGVPGEEVMNMLGLEPEASVELLTKLSASHGVRLDEASPTVRQVCETLDHLPLALELASSRVRVLGIDTLATLLSDRMRLLEGSNDVETHHQTLELAIASSFDDLDRAQQRTLCRFSQFAGPFDLAAATGLATAATDVDEIDAVRHVIDLAERSLLAIEEDTGTTRYRLLESIRLFADERLEESERNAVDEAHATYFADRVRSLAAEMAGPSEPTAARSLTAEWPDIGRAVAWGRLHRRPDVAIGPLVSLGFHLLWQHRQDGFEWLDDGAEAMGDLGDQQYDADLVRAVGAWMNGDIDRSERLLAAAVDLGGTTTMAAFIRIHQAMARFDYELLATSADTAWELATAGDDANWVIVTTAIRFNSRALHDIDDPELPTIESDLDTLIEKTDWPTGLCWGLFAKTTVNTLRADVEAALRFERELAAVAAECGAPWFPLTASGLTAGLHEAGRDPADRLHAASRALRAAVDANDLAQIPMYLHAAVVHLAATDQPAPAARLLGLIPEVPGVGSGGELAPGFEAAAEQVRLSLSADQLTNEQAAGKRSTLQEAAEVVEKAASAARQRYHRAPG